MFAKLPLTLRSVLLLAVACSSQWCLAAEGPKKQALLIGCTKYENPSISALNGPRNDVPAMARLLQSRFGFAEQDIRKLYDWPDDPAARPTYDNIAAGFEALVRQASPGSQIVICMSGHGTQTPIPASQTDPLAPSNAEPDGLDEVFLPADAKSWSGEKLQNALRDDQIGAWLEAMKAKGAHVWIVFDCCHSGTMTRGVGDADEAEVHRTVDPADLGIPPAATRPANQPAAVAAPEVSTLELPFRQKDSAKSGSVVAFYAAQSFEEAPDLPRPASAPRKPEFFYGLLTYTLSQALEQQKTPLSYRNLGRIVISRYRAERGSRGPTPTFAGDLDHEVLGAAEWPKQASITLERREDQLLLDAGTIRGVTPGSVLAIERPMTDATPNQSPLGYVVVEQATAYNATAKPCAHAGSEAVALEAIPQFSACRIAVQDVGDMRLKVWLNAAAGIDQARRQELLRTSFAALSEETKPLVIEQATAENADFELRCEPPRTATASDGRGWCIVQLVATPGQVATEKGAITTAAAPLRTYRTRGAAELAAALSRDLHKVYTWRNVWRIAGGLSGPLGAESADLKLEVAALANPRDTSGGKLLQQSFVEDGQSLEVRVANTGYQDYWVTLLFLSADYSIDVWVSDAVKRGGAFQPLRSTIDGAANGPEGFVLLAASMREQRDQPRFDILEQTALGQQQTASKRSVPSGPFGQLIGAAALGQRTRDADVLAADNPVILSASWVTLPKGTRAVPDPEVLNPTVGVPNPDQLRSE